jgi:hypothetical protein
LKRWDSGVETLRGKKELPSPRIHLRGYKEERRGDISLDDGDAGPKIAGMKRYFLPVVVALTAMAAADDVADAKKVFEQYVEYRNSGDLRVLDLISEESTFSTMQAGEGFFITSPNSNHRKGLESAMKKKVALKEVFEEVKFTQMGKASVLVEGICHPTGNEFKGPFRMLLQSNDGGAMKIAKYQAPFPLSYTSVKSHEIFEFKMPGEWKPEKVEKVDLGDGVVMFPGYASATFGALNYVAFEDANSKTTDRELNTLPMVVAEPLLSNFARRGFKEEGRDYKLLNEANPDQGFYSFILKAPTGETVYLDGLVLRTKKRIYVIQQMGPSLPQVALWAAVAKGFKEL